MQVFESTNTTPMTLDHQTVGLTCDCPRKCGVHCHLRLGFLMATYCRRYGGKLDYVFTSSGESRRGHWTNIDDNTEVFIEYSGKCDGHLEIELRSSGGMLAMWTTKKPTGLPITLNGNHVSERACFSLLCTGGEKELPVRGVSDLNIAGLVKTINVHGGVRRYFELGNAFVEGGHKYSLYAETLKEKTPWIKFLGNQKRYGSWGNEKFDVALTGASECFSDLVRFNADRRVVLIVAKFYADRYIKLWREYGERIRWIGVASEWNKGMEEINGVCIPGGVNTKFFTPQFQTEKRKPVVAFYARLGDGRGVERIMALAKGLVHEAEFIGFDTPGYETIDHGLPSNVKIVMTPTQESLRDVLQKSDVVVSAMRSAGWNNVICEGAACGCVPIATDAGTKDIILHGRTGFSCSTTWFEKEAMGYIIELGKNPDLMNRMAKRASAWVQQFDWTVVTEKIISEVMR